MVRVDGNEPAGHALQSREGLAAPEFMRIELASALLKYSRTNRITSATVTNCVREIDNIVEYWQRDASLIAAAADIAVARKHKIYDCLYLALALERREPLATADRRLAAIARDLSIETELIEPAL